MNFYFRLQVFRMLRLFDGVAIPPIVGLLLALVGFVGFSEYLYHSVSAAGWVLFALGLSALSTLGRKQRLDFLKQVFDSVRLRRVRTVENLLLSFPFLCVLAVKGDWIPLAALILTSVLFALIEMPVYVRRAIPTPFKRMPYEFIAGFRRGFWSLGLAVFFLVKAIQVENPYLGLFAVAIGFLASLSFYLKPEQPFFIWIYQSGFNRFMRRKIFLGMLGASVLTVPVNAAYLVCFPDQIWLALGLQVLGWLMMVFIVAAKYAAFPGEMNLPQAVMLAISLWFPPALLFTVPYLYKQAQDKISMLTE